MSEYEHILYEARGPVRLITLNRPETLNAITEPMEADLHEALDIAEADPEARVIIIQGAGRAFSSGYDIASFGETDPVSMIPKGQSAADHVSRWFYHDRNMLKNQTHILELSKPVIACVHGWCMGGGTWLSLTCDMTFCSEDAVFAQPEVRQISNTSFLWVLMAGYKNALRYSLTGDHIDAQEAFRIGLVNEVFADRDAMMEEAFRLAERIARISPETVAANKYVATLGLEMMGLRNAITTNWLLSSVAHSSQRPDYNRKEMLDAAMERGMRGFLDVRDGPFRPEPFGPRSEGGGVGSSTVVQLPHDTMSAERMGASLMTTTRTKIAPLEILETAEREFADGNYRKSSRLLWEATEATFRTLAKAHDLDPSDIRDVAIALDKKEGRRRYYRGKLLTGHFLRDHAEMDLVEDYELEEPHKSQPRFIRQCLQDLKADDARR